MNSQRARAATQAANVLRGLERPVHILIAAALLAWLCWFGAVRAFGTRTGVRQEVFDEPALSGRVLRDRLVPRLDGQVIGGPTVPRRNYSVRWTGYWFVEDPGQYDLYLGADDAAELRVDGRLVHSRNSEAGFSTRPVVIALTRGPHAIDVTYEQLEGGAFLNVLVAPHGAEPLPIEEGVLFPSAADSADVERNRWLDRARRLVVTLALAAAVALVASLVARYEAGRGEKRAAARSSLATPGTTLLRRWAVTAAGVLITLWAGTLRFEAIDMKYGPLEHPAWASAVGVFLENHGESWRPDSLTRARVEQPFIGGDPINYLKFAREMDGFYQAHVREPVFLATTRLFLHVLDNQDVAVSFASGLFSTLLVGSTFLLGIQALGFWPAAIASCALAGDTIAIDIGVEGWRDDAAATFFVLSAYALLRMLERSTWPRAVGMGVAGAGAGLTRITSVAFWLPGLLWFVAMGPGVWRTRVRLGLLALVVATTLVAPYLINCARAYGDPLYAVNYHTRFYRAREQAEFKQPMSAARYIWQKFATDPARTAGSMLYGLTVYPFSNKWDGFHSWGRYTGRLLAAASLLGLALFLASSTGRLLLGLTLLFLVPFAFTWNIRGGNEWRFTLGVYPILLLAAGLAITRLVQVLGRLVVRNRGPVLG